MNQNIIYCISGGVDSIALYNLLTRTDLKNTSKFSKVIDTWQKTIPKYNLLPVYFNHKIRPKQEIQHDIDTIKSNLVGSQKLTIIETSVDLKSENDARNFRRQELNKLVQQFKAFAIVEAHHSDDVLEQILLSYWRSFSRRALTSLRSVSQFSKNNSVILIRPFLYDLGINKQDIVNFAKVNKLSWNDDSTNNNLKFKRNQARNELKLISNSQKSRLLKKYHELLFLSDQIDQELNQIITRLTNSRKIILAKSSFSFDLNNFSTFNNDVIQELLVQIFRSYNYTLKSKSDLSRIFTLLTLDNNKFIQLHNLTVTKKRENLEFNFKILPKK